MSFMAGNSYITLNTYRKVNLIFIARQTPEGEERIELAYSHIPVRNPGEYYIAVRKDETLLKQYPEVFSTLAKGEGCKDSDGGEWYVDGEDDFYYYLRDKVDLFEGELEFYV